MTRRRSYEPDDHAFPHNAYSETNGRYAVAWRIRGWETEPDEDTEWSGIENRTGRIVAVMVGDDARHTFDPDDLSPIPDLAYCAECGQMGCGHDGRDRTEPDDDPEPCPYAGCHHHPKEPTR